MGRLITKPKITCNVVYYIEIDEKRLVDDEYESRTTDGVRLCRAAIVEKTYTPCRQNILEMLP